MDTCFECGGKLKIVSKPGRMTWDENDLYEIPTELKISTCIECGQPFEDTFVKTKIANAIRAQKKIKPNPKLLQLRWIDSFLDNMFKCPKMYGNKTAIYCQTILLLEFRELLLSKGLVARSREIQNRLHIFFQKKWPQLGTAAFPKNISLEDELIPALKEFCDVWINI